MTNDQEPPVTVRPDDPWAVRAAPGFTPKVAQAVRLVPDPERDGLLCVPAGKGENSGVYVLEVRDDDVLVIIPFVG